MQQVAGSTVEDRHVYNCGSRRWSANDSREPYAMVGTKEMLIAAYRHLGIHRDALIVRGFFVKERGFIDLHVDAETRHYHLWVTIPDAHTLVIRRECKLTGKRERARVALPATDPFPVAFGALADAMTPEEQQ